MVEAQSKASIRASVCNKIGVETWKAIKTFVEAVLWGLVRSSKFVSNSTLLVLYKDINGWGYGKLLNRVKQWYPVAQKTFQHNSEVLRHIMANWARSILVLGDANAWNLAARGIGLPQVIHGANLWLDSTDVRLIGKASVSRKDPSWSYKENSPARRYMTLSDARGRAVKIWNGYSPKVRPAQLPAQKIKRPFF
jgi:hypothetical protein